MAGIVDNKEAVGTIILLNMGCDRDIKIVLWFLRNRCPQLYLFKSKAKIALEELFELGNLHV